mmetsp:Transcript_10213/g.30318  ORF Transcript_10213/g.30318 Transcript_10213/m.30318 type:complete len:228 (+) Transcript_10213:1920-2603(+)
MVRHLARRALRGTFGIQGQLGVSAPTGAEGRPPELGAGGRVTVLRGRRHGGVRNRLAGVEREQRGADPRVAPGERHAPVVHIGEAFEGGVAAPRQRAAAGDLPAGRECELPQCPGGQGREAAASRGARVRPRRRLNVPSALRSGGGHAAARRHGGPGADPAAGGGPVPAARPVPDARPRWHAESAGGRARPGHSSHAGRRGPPGPDAAGGLGAGRRSARVGLIRGAS